MDLPDFLTLCPDDEIVLTGHRIGLYSIVDQFQHGLSAEEIHALYPTVAPELIRKVLAFRASHQSDVDAYVAEYRADLDRQEDQGRASRYGFVCL
jgi:uncharacterized protein (DUF433 family)